MSRDEGLTEAQWEKAGQACRAVRHGDMRPLWPQLGNDIRGSYVNEMQALDRALRRRGFCIMPLPEKTDG